jgi:uncharacterized protein (TIGR03000 family)
MYSIVLMAAVATGGPDAATFGKRGGCSGCYGGCYGSSYSYGCCGGYSYGCCGGYSCGGGGLFHKHRSHGCCGGYSYGCCGGYSCFGSGCYGGCYGATYPSYSYPGYYGAPPVVTVPPAGVPMTPVVPAPMTPATPDKDKVKKPETSGMGANLKFTLPAESKLFVDGRLVGIGGDRAFYTPALVPGQKYFYDVKAELVVDGKTVTEEKTVIVEAGANLTETFPKLTAAAAAPTAVAGK